MSVRTVDISVAGFAVPKHQPGTLTIKQRLGERGQCAFDIKHPLHVFTNQPTNDSVEIFSSSPSDTTQTVTLVGLDNADVRQTDTVTLNGTAQVTSTLAPNNWKTIYMVSKDADTVGMITMREASGNQTITTLGPTQVFKIDTLPWENGDEMEVTTFTNQPGSDSLELFSDDGSDFGETIIIIGTDATDTLQFESIDLNAIDATTPVTTVRNNWKTIHEVQVTLAAGLVGTLTVREASGNATVCTMYGGMLKNTDRLFGGIVENVKRSYKQRVDGGERRVVWTITATDWRQVLDRRAVAQSYSSATIATIINDVQADVTGTGKENFLTSWGGASTFTTGATLGDVVVQGITSEYSTVAEIFDECANAASAKWWIGQYKQIYMVLQSTQGGPFALVESANIFNVSEQDTTSNYRNRQNVAYNALTDSLTESLQSNDTESKNATSYILEYPVGQITSVTEDVPVVGAVTVSVGTKSSPDLAVASSTGGGFANQPTGGEVLEARSDNAGDTMRLSIVGRTGAFSTADSLILNGTTWVEYSNANAASGTAQSFNLIMAIFTDSPGAGTVTLRQKVSTNIIATIPDGQTQSGVIVGGAITNGNGIFVHLDASAEAGTAKTVGIKYVDKAGNAPESSSSGAARTGQGYASVALNGTSSVELPDDSSETIEDVQELYVGDLETARTVTFVRGFTWSYTVGDVSIFRTTTTDTLPDNTEIVVTYKGTYPAVAVHNDATEQTARAAAETGTGIWENSLVTERLMTTAEADALALDLYNRWPSFARKFKFSTLTEGWYTGDFSAVTWEDFALAGVDMSATEISIIELPAASGTGLQWTVTLSNRTVFDGDASFFRDLARKERATPNAERISTS